MDERNSGNRLKRCYLKNAEHFLQILMHIWNFSHLEKNDGPHTLNISEDIDP